MKQNNYSSSVLLTLNACGIELSLSHVGDDFVIVRDSQVEIESCVAELIVSVDGEVNRRQISLIDGVKKGDFTQASYADLSTPPNDFD